MKSFLGFLALVSCTIHHATSLAHISGMENWRTNPLYVSQNSNVRNPLLLGSSTSLNVLDKLQNIRNKLEEIENKNNDFPVISPVRGTENQFHSINSFVDASVTSDTNERARALQIRPKSLLEKIPVMPAFLNGYFMMFRAKQNISNSVPTKSQTRFTGNEQQHYIQQLSSLKPETTIAPVNQQQPLTIQRQVISQQKSLNNQQMHMRRLNIQDQLSGHSSLLGNQENLVNQQHLGNKQRHIPNGQQRSINVHQAVSDQISSTQQFSRNEGRMLDEEQNLPGSVSNQETSIRQHLPQRSLQPTTQQQPAVQMVQQVPSQHGMLSISHQSTINQYMRPQVASNLPVNENPTIATNNFEYPSGQQMQSFADQLLTKLQTRALNGESQPILIDSNNRNSQSRIVATDITRHQASLLADLERSHAVPVLTSASGSQILHETRLSTGASVKHHLKTPYANYDFSHLL